VRARRAGFAGNGPSVRERGTVVVARTGSY
jgi:hypothetical protein